MVRANLIGAGERARIGRLRFYRGGRQRRRDGMLDFVEAQLKALFLIHRPRDLTQRGAELIGTQEVRRWTQSGVPRVPASDRKPRFGWWGNAVRERQSRTPA